MKSCQLLLTILADSGLTLIITLSGVWSMYLKENLIFWWGCQYRYHHLHFCAVLELRSPHYLVVLPSLELGNVFSTLGFSSMSLIF